jgi:xanthine dehydrogenase accessory factor
MKAFKFIPIIGGGEFASAIAFYLWKAHLPTVMVVLENEIHLRRPVCFGEAAKTGQKQIENANAILINADHLASYQEESSSKRWQKAIQFHHENNSIPIFLLEELPGFLEILKPDILIQTIGFRKYNFVIDAAPLVIGLYPYHQPGTDCHVCVETRLNHWLGSMYHHVPPEYPEIDLHLFRRTFDEVNSPLEGVFVATKEIGEEIEVNEALGTIQNIEIRSPYKGQIWGLVHSGKIIFPKQPLALIYDGKSDRAFTQFDFRHRVVAGAVLREIFHFQGNF